MKWIAMLVLLVGCTDAHAVAPKKEARGPSAPNGAARAPAAPSGGGGPATTDAKDRDLSALTKPVEPPRSAERVPLGERLAREAAARPAHAVRPQQLIAALAQRGVKVTRQRQVLASPVDALYCELLSAPALAISLCEYSDEDAAERGRALSHATFDALIPGRTLDTRFNSLLTVTQPAGADRELVRRTFAELEPS